MASQKKPGDIIKSANIKFRDPHGRYYFTSEEGRGYLDPKLMPDEAIQETYTDLICLGRDRYGICNYEDRLIRYFYHKNGRISHQAEYPYIWIPRWKQINSRPSTVDCRVPNKKDRLPAPPKFRSWRIARTKDWIMPVLSSVYSEEGQESLPICPSALKTKTKTPDPLPPVYNPDLYSAKTHPPLVYEASIIRGDKDIPIRIYLHGTLDPLKWHYDLWAHLLSGTPNANRIERKKWESWLEKELPDKEKTQKIFENCHAKEGGGNCEQCSVEQFKRVHANIRELSHIYWQQIVTFWESGATKQITAKENGQNYQNYHTIEVKISKKIGLQLKNGRWIHTYPLLIIKGWSYNFNEPEPVLHLNPVTFYFKPKNPLITENKLLPPSELKDVKRI